MVPVFPVVVVTQSLFWVVFTLHRVSFWLWCVYYLSFRTLCLEVTVSVLTLEMGSVNEFYGEIFSNLCVHHQTMSHLRLRHTYCYIPGNWMSWLVVCKPFLKVTSQTQVSVLAVSFVQCACLETPNYFLKCKCGDIVLSVLFSFRPLCINHVILKELVDWFTIHAFVLFSLKIWLVHHSDQI